MLHLDDVGLPAPHLPQRGWTSATLQLALSAGVHLAAAALLVLFAGPSATPAVSLQRASASREAIDVRHMIFIARDPRTIGGGGGGGGNRGAQPIRRARSVGSDQITLRVAKPTLPPNREADLPFPPQLLVDAKSLASGSFEQVGLPTGGVSLGTSTGPGFGGGAGEGVGIGIGSGRGPGIGLGSGGGIGGGVYRPGGAVTMPRVIVEVSPTYTSEALDQRIQGAVVLELVVQSDGCPSAIRIVRSLDPRGLDQQAILAASQWRFEPGRLAGTPVDVLVTIVLDFSIR